MPFSYESLGVLLLATGVVAMIARRARLPYTFVLVLAGLALSLLPLVKEPPLSDRLLFALLPGLIFETAYGMGWRRFKAVLPSSLWLAIPGVIFSVAAIACGLIFVGHWDIRAALLLAVILSPTDPVAVVSTLKSLGLRKGFRSILDAESLLNDGTAAVGFKICLALALGSSVSPIAGFFRFLWIFGGSVAIGFLVGFLLVRIAGRTEDYMVELTFSTLAAYGSFLLAQETGFSGIISTLVAGIVFGSSEGISHRGREAVQRFWEYIAFVANSFVFLLIGYRLADRDFADYSGTAFLVIILSLVGRMVGVYSSVYMAPFVHRVVKHPEEHLMVAAGLRGALSIALCLSIPPEYPLRRQILTSTFAVVAFSVVVQTLLLKPIAKWVCVQQQAQRSS